jgi:2-polyprenyl-6-methoxyphenol hydroxylase-like FAD-dependent oxidoreductase
MKLPATTLITIVGAGPSGLALAAELRRLGAEPLLVDRLSDGANTSRAAVVHARTLEVLSPLDVTERLLANGVRVPTFRVRDRDRTLIEIDFTALDTAYPFTLMCPQSTTEVILLDRLRTLGGSVERPLEAAGIEPRADGVTVTLADAGGARMRVDTSWLIGCDGAHSAVRAASGVAFDGGDYEESFVLADVRMDWPLPREEVSLFFSPAGLMVVAPLPNGRFRIVATVDTAPEHPDLDFVRSILATRGPTDSNATLHEIVWTSRFRLQHRVAATPRKGRILLCGDAAHLHSPAGGQGMNTGIQDAVSLAQPLLDALHTGSERGLDLWAERRHQVASGVVAMTDRMTRAATLKSKPARALRNLALEIAGHVPGITTRLAQVLAELDNR